MNRRPRSELDAQQWTAWHQPIRRWNGADPATLADVVATLVAPFTSRREALLATVCVDLLLVMVTGPALVVAIGIPALVEQTGHPARTISRALKLLYAADLLLRPKRGTKGNGVSEYKVTYIAARRVWQQMTARKRAKRADGLDKAKAAAARAAAASADGLAHLRKRSAAVQSANSAQVMTPPYPPGVEVGGGAAPPDDPPPADPKWIADLLRRTGWKR